MPISAKSAYLFAYNSALASTWAYVLFLMFRVLAQGKGTADVAEAVSSPLQIAQTAAVLEVVHSALGVVRSPFFTTFIQVLSRMWALWGIIYQAPRETATGSVKLFQAGSLPIELNVVTLLFAWGVTEVLRYGFFAVKEIGTPPFAQLWLRYSAFIPLYPLGVASEMTMAYLALPVIRANRPLSISMPNWFNWGFDYYYFCWVAIAAYLPGLPVLYLHMLKQRKKILGKPKPKAA